ncbi:hypothetical protein ACHAXA_001086 [Cyclostephanos tholiformis]|uniref:Acyltransferase n=1 Tax=Cyclostephanos tholiformis TaxID=382380 RepID=A0ABD3R372_9STRA
MKRPRPRPITSPLLPRGVEIIVPPPPHEACTLVDRLLVYASSLIVVGSPIWFYGGLIFLYRRWRKYRALAHERSTEDDEYDDDEYDEYDDDDEYENGIGDSRRRHRRRRRRRSGYDALASRYGAALATIILLSIFGPHRRTRLGEMLGARRWRLWDAWLNYVGYTVLRDGGDDDDDLDRDIVPLAMDDASARTSSSFDPLSSPAIYAFVPHGIFPFGLAFSCLPERGYDGTWGEFRPVVATATRLFPLVRTFIDWMGGVDASRRAVSRVLSSPTTAHQSTSSPGGRRLGISPGGIAEMFETYPKPGYHPNDEAALLRHRDGMFKLALRHHVPIVPVYCFGATKMFRRVQLPRFVETLSRALRISILLLYGRWGLPIPFRQRLMYVVGRTIWPPASSSSISDDQMMTGERFDCLVREMHDAFCDEIERIFYRNRSHYGWENKTLRLV